MRSRRNTASSTSAFACCRPLAVWRRPPVRADCVTRPGSIPGAARFGRRARPSSGSEGVSISGAEASGAGGSSTGAGASGAGGSSTGAGAFGAG
eukprot:31016-Pelagococcus_subviridis.AAC.8